MIRTINDMTLENVPSLVDSLELDGKVNHMREQFFLVSNEEYCC